MKVYVPATTHGGAGEGGGFGGGGGEGGAGIRVRVRGGGGNRSDGSKSSMSLWSCEEASGSQRPQRSRRRRCRNLPELRARRGATRNASTLIRRLPQLLTAPRRISGHSNRWSPAAKQSTDPVWLSEQVHTAESPGHACCAVHASALLLGVGGTGGVEGGGDVLLVGRPEMPQTRPPACSHATFQVLLERARPLGAFALAMQTMASSQLFPETPARSSSRRQITRMHKYIYMSIFIFLSNPVVVQPLHVSVVNLLLVYTAFSFKFSSSMYM